MSLHQLVQKAKTVQYKVRARAFKRSSAWRSHPHNRQIAKADTQGLEQGIAHACRDHSVPFADLMIDGDEYDRFKRQFKLPALSLYALRCRDKKIAEHLIAARLLQLRPGNRYVDVASESSPFPLLFQKVLGVDAYSQDLTYPAGVHGKRIGSSAEQLPVPDAWIDGVSLQCAFEHFQGDIDSRFVHELARVLKPNGRCVIVPLYMHTEAFNIYDPLLYSDWDDRVADQGATVVAEMELGGHFERLYAPQTLRRILIPRIGLSYTVFAVRGLDAIALSQRLDARETAVLKRVQYALLIQKSARPDPSAG